MKLNEKYDKMLEEGWNKDFVNELKIENVFETAIESLKRVMKGDVERGGYNIVEIARKIVLAYGILDDICNLGDGTIEWFLDEVVAVVDNELDVIDIIFRYREEKTVSHRNAFAGEWDLIESFIDDCMKYDYLEEHGYCKPKENV